MNPLMMLGNLNNNSIVMKAFGAMMRGENPQTFLKNLANTEPKLQGLDLDNLENTARSLCEQNNVNMEELADTIRGFANSNK